MIKKAAPDVCQRAASDIMHGPFVSSPWPYEPTHPSLSSMSQPDRDCMRQQQRFLTARHISAQHSCRRLRAPAEEPPERKAGARQTCSCWSLVHTPSYPGSKQRYTSSGRKSSQAGPKPTQPDLTQLVRSSPGSSVTVSGLAKAACRP